MSKLRAKTITYHCAKKYDETGTGCVSKRFKGSDFQNEEEMLNAIRLFKEDMKLKNKEYRMSQVIEEAPNESIIIEEMIPDFKNDINLKLNKGTGNTTTLIASSQQGKSYMMTKIYQKYYSSGKWITTLYTQSPQSFGGINSVKSSNLIIFPGFDNKVILCERLINRGTDNKYNFCNMFDDQINIRDNKIINDSILTFRNSNMSTVLCIQYSNLLSKMSRANYNNILLGKLNTDEAIEVAIKTFLRQALKNIGINSLADQINFYKKNIKDYGFIHYIPSEDTISFVRL